MNTKLLISAAAASLIALAGCGTNPTNAQIGTATGAVARREHVAARRDQVVTGRAQMRASEVNRIPLADAAEIDP